MDLNFSRKNNVYTLLYQGLKRLIDIVLSFLLLVFLSPLLLFIAMMIKLTSHGPVIFSQERYGYKKKPFLIYKFRTLHHYCTHKKGGDQIKQEDYRLTSFGRFMRCYSLDELPQLFNILKGNMSFVGPRPHAIDHHHYYQKHIPRYNKRLTVVPGLTGLAQIEGWRGATPRLEQMIERLECDCTYIRQRSLATDMRILCLTVVLGAWRTK
jgi:putative colanic acid biosynthesis UDP-glucose lipid carrier transferase